RLVFYLLNANVWLEFDVQTGKLTQSTTWPLQPPLTPSQQQDFQIVVRNGEVSRAFASPNNRYIVYGAQQPSNWTSQPGAYLGDFPLAIADLSTGQHFTTSIPIEDTTVLWSNNSTTFVVKTINNGNIYRLYYVTNFATSLSALTAKEFSELTVGGQALAL